MGIGNVIAYTTHSRSGSGDPVFDMKRCLEHRLMPLRKLTILHIVLEVELQDKVGHTPDMRSPIGG
jgi:hypothetical protein